MIRKLHCTYAHFICISMASSSWLPVMNGAFAGDVHICGTVASIVSSCTACTLSVLCTWPMCVQMCSSMEVLHQPLGCGVQDFITARNNVRGCGCTGVHLLHRAVERCYMGTVCKAWCISAQCYTLVCVPECSVVRTIVYSHTCVTLVATVKWCYRCTVYEYTVLRCPGARCLAHKGTALHMCERRNAAMGLSYMRGTDDHCVVL